MAEVRASDLTPGEKLYLNRLRQGLTQIEMSVDLGVILSEYRAMEKDINYRNAPFVRLRKLSPVEQCIILRRRKGLTRSELGEQLNVSGEWIRKMETSQAPIDKLATWWGLQDDSQVGQ